MDLNLSLLVTAILTNMERKENMLKIIGKTFPSEHVPWAAPTNLVKFNEHQSYYLLSLPNQKTSGVEGLKLTLETGTSLIKGLGTGTRGVARTSPF